MKKCDPNVVVTVIITFVCRCRYWPREGGCWEYFGIPYVSVCDEDSQPCKSVTVDRYSHSMFEEKIL